MGKNLYHVKLTEFEHRGHSCFELEFEFNTLLKELIKSIKEIAWSTGRKTFYVPKNKLTLHQLYTQLKLKRKLPQNEYRERLVMKKKSLLDHSYVTYVACV